MSKKKEEITEFEKALDQRLAIKTHMNTMWKTVFTIPFVVLIHVVVSLVFGLLWAFAVAPAWNYVIPYVFGLPTIGYWHAFLLLFVMTSLWKIAIVKV